MNTRRSPRKNKGRPPNKSQDRIQGDKKSVVLAEQKSVTFSGPIPHPDLLKDYDDLLPGAADRILQMAEQDAEHTRYIEKEALTHSLKYISKGQYLGFLIGVFALLIALLCAFLDQPIPSSVIGASGVVGLVTAFLKMKK